MAPMKRSDRTLSASSREVSRSSDESNLDSFAKAIFEARLSCGKAEGIGCFMAAARSLRALSLASFSPSQLDC